MKRISIFPLSARGFAVVLCTASALAFLLLFFLSPPSTEYKYDRTETAKVVEVRVSTQTRYGKAKAEAFVEFQDGTNGSMIFPTHRNILKGQLVSIEVLETDGKKPRYRLAQEPIAP